MDKVALKEFLQKKYENPEAFLENVIFPVFGEDNYDDSGSYHWLRKHPEDQTAADNSGILDILVLGSIYVEGSQLDIFDITVASKHQLANSRVGIQQLIRRIISTHSGAFMIFHYKTTERWDWRFTFCHKGASQLDSSDAKRYTFLLGPGQSCRTAAENFCKLGEKIATDGEFDMDDIIKAFDVEALSKEFFDKYKAQYEKFVEYMADEENGMREDFIDTDFDTDGLTDEEICSREEKPLRDYVKKLLGRIVFLHFIQKKGWLGVEPGKDWGEGDMDFMMNLFEKATDSQKENFLDEVLEPIFEQALNTDRSDKDDLFDTGVEALPNKGILKIPYLNGGLFEREASDEPDSVFPAEYFHSLLTFLYQYNFTIDENDPNDAQVGIDPEMLGRIFENLLEDNKDKGAFYTPKEIVQYMCRESLIAYLQTDKADDEKQTIRDFVSSYDVTPLSESLKQDIDSKLRSVKICDPAIGSGAFPMGLLKEIFYCRGAIENFDEAAEIKKDIIQNNIYGVDIEKGAVDIARLRFWLSIIVDEKAPHCLPNMDFKIMQGNSLIEDYRGIDLSGLANGSGRKKKKGDDGTQLSFNFGTEDVLENIHVQMDAYYKLSDHKKKNEAREVINELVKTYIKKYTLDNPEISAEIDALPIPNDQFFLWHTYFADVFQNDGFDIVIENPPYVEFKNMSSKMKSGHMGFITAKGKYDLYIPFIEFSQRICNNNGIITIICPTRFLKRDYGKTMRKYIDRMMQIKSIVDFGDYQIFDNALTYTGVFSFFASKKCDDYLFEYLCFGKSLNVKKDKVFQEAQKHLISSQKLSEDMWDFNFGPKERLLDKIKDSGLSLLSICEGIYQGIATGKDDVFVVNNDTVGNCNLETPILHPFIKGKDISRFRHKNIDRFIIYPYDSNGKVIPEAILKKCYPNIYNYLLSKRDDLKGRSYFDKSNKLWYELWNQRSLSRFQQAKIITLDNASCNSFTVDFDNLLGTTTVYSLILKDEYKDDILYVLGILNSRLIDFFHKNKTIPQSGGYYRYQALFIANLPIKIVRNTDLRYQKVVNCVTELLQCASIDDDNSYLIKLNQMVYEIYGINGDELNIIDSFYAD